MKIIDTARPSEGSVQQAPLPVNKKTPVLRKCKTPHCRNQAPPQRLECNRCRTKKYRLKNPVVAARLITMHNAIRRGKPFTLTLEEFRTFCRETNYIAGKGRTKTSLTIDRINNELGYVPGNIRVLPLIENVRKGTKVLHYDYQTGAATVTDGYQPAENNTENPF